MNRLKAVRFIPLVLIVVGVWAYHNSFQGPFILDDIDNVVENSTIRHLWPIWTVLAPSPTSPVAGRPVVNLSLALNYAIGGANVQGYHVFNLAVHVLAALTLYGIVRRTLLRPALCERFGAAAEWIALIVATIWMVHPLQTEAVTYISQRCESLMGLFYLLTLYAFIRGAETKRPARWFGVSMGACWLGMASKEVMVTAPLMVLLYDRTFVGGAFREAWTRHRRLYLGLASSWLLLGYLMSGLHSRNVGYGLGVPWGGYALTECRAIMHYLRLSVWPHPLIFDYGFYTPTRHLAAVAPSALILILLATVVVLALKRPSAIGFAGVWLFVVLAPTSSVVPIVGSPMAEHRMYLPLASIVVLAVVGVVALGKRLFQERQRIVLGCVASGAIVALLTSLTIQRNRDYRSALDIWKDTVGKCPNNPRAHYMLGLTLAQLGRRQEAIAHYVQALQMQPNYAEAHNNLGIALVEQGRLQEAIGHYQQALQIRPDFATAQNNLGNALFLAGKVPEAIGHYEQALRFQPDYVDAHYNLANVLLRSGKVPEAIGHYEEVLRIQPDYAEAHNNLGIALAQQGRLQEAIGHYEQALRLKPNFVQAQNNLARARAAQ